MNLGLITIGDELLSGRTQDRNALWFGRCLAEYGLNLRSVLTVPDEREALTKALSFVLETADGAVTSGGLGPTKDDITKEVLAEFCSTPLEDNPQAQETVEKHYKRAERKRGEEFNRYHFIPQGATAVFNPVGLAPGLALKKDGKPILAAPGVPEEFQAMIKMALPQFVGPSTSPTQTVTVRTAGISEEDIFGRLAPELWKSLAAFGKVASLPQAGGVDIVVTRQGDGTEENIKEAVEASPLAPYVWAWEDITPACSAVRAAQSQGATFAFAESCTGGLAASGATDVPGASAVFLGSFVTYSNEMKKQVLGVREETLGRFGAVSVEVACEMAQQAREKSGATLAVSLSGIAGPGGGTQEKPVGTLALGLSQEEHTRGRLRRYRGIGREGLKRRFAREAHFLLLKALRNQKEEFLWP